MDADELQAVVEARKELGPEHEQHLIAGFLDRMDKEIERRVDAKLAARRPKGRRGLTEAELGIFVPIFIAAGIFGGGLGIAAVAAALVALFRLQAFTR